MEPHDSDKPRSSIQGGISFGRAARARDRQIEALEVTNPLGVDRDTLWATARRFAAGVTVVTTTTDTGFVGITVSAFSLLSLEPPLVLVCINNDSQVREAIELSGNFAVTVLSSRQELQAEMFAGRTPRPDPYFADVPHRTLLTGAPILKGGLAWFDCYVDMQHDGGDHALFIGRAVASGVAADQDDPLLYFGSQYRRLMT